MTQMQVVRGVATKIEESNKDTIIRLYTTEVVKFNAETITLNSGNYRTATTRTRMNQASNEFNLGYKVFQKDFDWFVEFRGKTMPFIDGMVLDR